MIHNSNSNEIHSYHTIQPNIFNSNSNSHQVDTSNYSVRNPVKRNRNTAATQCPLMNPEARNITTNNTTTVTAYPASFQLLQQQQQQLQQLQMLKLLAQQQQQQQPRHPVLSQQPQMKTPSNTNITQRPPPLLAPERADATWAQELYEMEPPEREAINYELHGVQSRAVPETPEFLHIALQQLTVYVDTVLQPSEKRAYTYAVQTLQSTYVHTDELKVRFLRAELFDVSKAARRYCHGLQYLYDHFGDIALLRQLHLADLNAEETQFLHKGFKQLLPSRDRFGRRMMAHFGSYSSTYSYVTRAKVVTYLTFGTSWMNRIRPIDWECPVCVFFFLLPHFDGRFVLSLSPFPPIMEDRMESSSRILSYNSTFILTPFFPRPGLPDRNAISCVL